MFLKEDFTLGVVKEVGNDHVVLDVDDEEVTVHLSPIDAKDLQQHLITQDNLLVPIHRKTHELFLQPGETWKEADLEELTGLNDGEVPDDE